jgi:uncharacterized protein (TIRG00374 family)
VTDDSSPSSSSDASTPLGLPPGALRWGVIVFVAASVVGFAALFFYSQDVSASLQGFRRFDLVWALPCLAFASMDWFGGGVRVWLLLRPLDLRVGYWDCVKISGTTAGLAYLTPSGVGGGPAHLYGLVRTGVSVGKAAASNFASLLVNLIFLTTAGFAAWFFGAAATIREVQLPGVNLSAATLFEWTVSVFAGVVVILVLFAANPRPVRGWVLRIFGSGQRVRTVLRWIHELHGSLLIYARKGKLALFLATLSGALHFGGRFLLGWGVLRGFGIEAGFWNIVTLHVLLQFLLIFMPTPGGSGVGEILAPALMRPFLPSSLLVAYTAVWRFFLTYVNVLAGGGLLLRWVGLDQAKLAENVAPTGKETGEEREVAESG